MSTEQKTAAPEAATEQAAPKAAAVPQTPLQKLTARLGDIINKAKHTEMWGVELTSESDHAPTQVILQKFLRANNSDVAAAEKQLTSALEWRKKVQPTSLLKQTFEKQKFQDLGFVTTHKVGERSRVITWNIYGAVKDNKATFGNVEEFVKWRAALMELGVQKLNLNDITEPIPEDGTDPHQMLQVHDYQSVSFLRMDPHVKAASRETIQVFSMAYPELLEHKYFVNVPAIMGWVFGAMKLFLSPATLKKFHPMTSGTTLATELKGFTALPKEYGGEGPSVKEGMTVTLADMPTATEAKEETETAQKPAEGESVEGAKAEAVAENGPAAATTEAEPNKI